MTGVVEVLPPVTTTTTSSTSTTTTSTTVTESTTTTTLPSTTTTPTTSTTTTTIYFDVPIENADFEATPALNGGLSILVQGWNTQGFAGTLSPGDSQYSQLVTLAVGKVTRANDFAFLLTTAACQFFNFGKQEIPSQNYFVCGSLVSFPFSSSFHLPAPPLASSLHFAFLHLPVSLSLLGVFVAPADIRDPLFTCPHPRMHV